MPHCCVRPAIFAVFTVALVSLPGIASAQDTLASEPQTPPCELHIWPAPGLGETRQHAGEYLDARYIGPFMSRSDTTRVDDDAAVGTAAAQPDGPLSTAIQLAAIEATDPAPLLGLAGYTLILHPRPLDSRTLRTATGRLATGAKTACYAELILSDIVYSREFAHGQNLKTFAHLRSFGEGPSPQRRFATWVQTDLPHDRTTAETSAEQLDSELLAAFTANIRKFAALPGARR